MYKHAVCYYLIVSAASVQYEIYMIFIGIVCMYVCMYVCMVPPRVTPEHTRAMPNGTTGWPPSPFRPLLGLIPPSSTVVRRSTRTVLYSRCVVGKTRKTVFCLYITVKALYRILRARSVYLCTVQYHVLYKQVLIGLGTVSID